MKTNNPRSTHALKEFDKSLFIAAHFGFLPIDAPKVIPQDLQMTEDCIEQAEHTNGHAICDAKEKAAFIRTYIEKDFASLPHPLAIAWKKTTPEKNTNYSLELVGFPPGIAEAKLIRTALSILIEEGKNELVVEVNSIGDKDSISAYERELANHLRKIHASLPVEVKKQIKEDIFNLLKAEDEEIKTLRSNLPSSIASLTSSSRAHFKEVLEYLEALGVEFRMAPELVGNKHFCSETLFAIRDMQTHTLLAVGYRYSRLSKRFGFKKELSLMGATLFGTADDKGPKKVYKELPRPKFYLVHLGRDAKMKALPLIELLRNNKIPLYHFLGKDKITAQLQTAENLRAPYLIIVGQKEAIDNTVTIRNVATRAQDTVPMQGLPEYLKNIPF